MNVKKQTSFGIFISIIFCILYLIFAAKPLSKEFQFNPVWKISVANPPITKINNPEEKLLYYHLGQTAGYFTQNGEVSLYKTFPSKVSISNEYYAIYDSDSQNIPFYNNKNEQAGIISVNGFPYFVEDLIYVFMPGGSSLCKCNSSGEPEWFYEGTIPISAFACNHINTVIGLADGTIKVLNNESGSTELIYEPGGSDYSVILGLAISDDSEYIASISGQDKQRFVVTHKEGNKQKIIYHTNINDNSPNRTGIYFTKDNKRIFYNYKNSLGIYNIKSNTNKTIKLQDKIISIKQDDNFVYLLSKNKQNYTISIIESTDTIEGQFSFTADSAFIQTYNNNLFVGKDTSISKIEITKE